MSVLVDGIETDCVPADDRGLLYGDLVFETIAFHDGAAPLWERHFRRLERGCLALGLPRPDQELLTRECAELASGHASCVIRISITRGSGGRGYEPPEDPRPRRIIRRRPWPENLVTQRDRGLVAITGSIRLATGSALAGLKHGNRLEQVLAAREVHHAGADEALVYDASGTLVEAVSSNVVIVIDDRALTPAIDGAGVRGVGLEWLRDQPGVRIEDAAFGAAEIERAGEIMVINSVAGIRPLVRLDGRDLAAGPVCRHWQRIWRQELEG